MTGDWSKERWNVAYTEARAVIDAQNTTMTDIDDKAMRTVRLNAALLGLLITALQLAPQMFHGMVLRASFASLICSTVCGIVTYNESNIYVGPRGEYLETLAGSRSPEGPWGTEFLETMSGMIAENYDDIRRNSGWLTATQIALVCGIVTAVAAVGI